MTDALTLATQDQHEVEQMFAGSVYNGGDYARHHAGWLSPDVFTDEVLAEIQEFSVRPEFIDDVCLVGMEVAKLASPGCAGR